jgi:hypothetical protein
MMSLGIMFLAFGFVSIVINFLSAHFGTRHQMADVFGLGALVVGAGLAGGAYLLHRSSGNNPPPR